MNEIQDLTIESEQRQNNTTSNKKSISIKLRTAKNNEKSSASTPKPVLTVDVNSNKKPLDNLQEGINHQWDLECVLIGSLVPKNEGMLVICTECDRPIIVYGRLVNCKHLFCYDCAKRNRRKCPRCGGLVNNIDEIKRGPLYICPFKQCLKGYLHIKDFFNHVDSRHRDENKSDNIQSNPNIAYILRDVQQNHQMALQSELSQVAFQNLLQFQNAFVLNQYGNTFKR